MADRIPNQLISEIIDANDIVDLVSKYVRLKRSSSSFVGLCPFHKEKTPSFHVNPERQLYHCFGCNAGGNVLEFVKNIENLDFIEAVKLLAERANIKINTEGFSKEDNKLYEKKQNIFKINLESAKFFREMLFSEEGKEARSYIEKRLLNKDTVFTYGLGFAPSQWDTLTKHLLSHGFKRELLVEAGISVFSEKGQIYDRFRDRLMFPIIDPRGNIIGFGGRIMGEGNVKYLNSPETPVFNKRKNLFSLNLAKNYANGELILVEGYMDVISLYQNGIKNAVASLGTALTTEQARLASRFASTVIVCYDTDEAGIKATQRTIDIFKGLEVKLKILPLPEGKDPDEYIKKNGSQRFKETLKNAYSVAGYRIMLLKNKYNINDINEKVEYVSECAKILSEIDNSIERDVYITKISEETGIAQQAIQGEIKKISKKNISIEKRAAVKNSKFNTDRMIEGKNANNILKDSERKLISLCISDNSVYNKLKEYINTELFTFETHKKIIEYFEKDKNFEPAVIVSMFTDEEAADAAAALSMPLNFESNLNAAKELIDTIDREKYNFLIKNAINSDDVEKLNSLIMEKNKRDKERRELSDAGIS